MSGTDTSPIALECNLILTIGRHQTNLISPIWKIFKSENGEFSFKYPIIVILLIFNIFYFLFKIIEFIKNLNRSNSFIEIIA